ncbi:MAG: biosynthetic-type acetolactate synthase large subunit, partial [Gemmatimonadota bacterium]
VLCRHEQGAGHAAQGYARASGDLGVCVATSGPGATNLVTPIAGAWMDGTPLVAITGQVSSSLLGTDAFQETDFIGITLPIVKHSYLVTRADEIARVVADAVDIARGGRPGPVVIDVTKDAQQGRAARDPMCGRHTVSHCDTRPSGDGEVVRALDALARARRPLILAGQGVLQSGATAELADLAEWLDAPVATTLLGLGTISQNHPLSIGLAGMHGEVHVNRALQRCDVLLSVGARFDDRVTGRADRFAPRAIIIHIDIEPAQIGKTVRAAIELTGDARAVLRRLRAGAPTGERTEWRRSIAADASRRASRHEPEGSPPTTELSPATIYRELDAAVGHRADIRFVTDVGQHQMWAAQLLTWRRPGTHITSGGAGTMGFAVPAALGAALARPDETIWAIVGDGGFQMTSQELATIMQERVRNVKIAIINNGYLGMVRQWQQLFHQRRYSGTPLSGPDFAELGRAYGLHALVVDRPDEVAGAIAAAQALDETVLIDFRVEREANVFPITPPGAAVDGMMERAEVAP